MTGFQYKRAVALHDLIDRVMDQIAIDFEGSDLTALQELLMAVPRENLIAYLPEEKQGVKWQNWTMTLNNCSLTA